jgi:hypothetical protein
MGITERHDRHKELKHKNVTQTNKQTHKQTHKLKQLHHAHIDRPPPPPTPAQTNTTRQTHMGRLGTGGGL